MKPGKSSRGPQTKKQKTAHQVSDEFTDTESERLRVSLQAFRPWVATKLKLKTRQKLVTLVSYLVYYNDNI